MRARNVRSSADEHAQTSMSEHGDRHSPRPAGAPDGAEAVRRAARGGRAAICRRNPSSRGRGAEVSASVRRAYIPDTYAASGPEPGTWRDPDPRDGAAGDQRAQDRPACPAMAATRRLLGCPVSTTSWRYGLRRTCRLVTGRSHRPRSTWPNQVRLPLLAVTHRYNRAVVFGSNNFRSPITQGWWQRGAGNAMERRSSIPVLGSPLTIGRL